LISDDFPTFGKPMNETFNLYFEKKPIFILIITMDYLKYNYLRRFIFLKILTKNTILIETG